MNLENRHSGSRDPLATAYDIMLERIHALVGQPGNRVFALRADLAFAREKAVELSELTREEATRIAMYLERDLHDAAVFIAETGQELRQWWRFDVQQVEERVLDMFSSVADQTSLQLRAVNETLRQTAIYQAGEVTGPGTLVCDHCGLEQHFPRSCRIDLCTSCHGKEFHRERITA